MDIRAHLEEVGELGKYAANSGNITKSFFANVGITYKLKKRLGKAVFGQAEDYTCVAASLRTLLNDLGIVRSEEFLASALGTTYKGANILDIPKALEKVMKTGNRKAIVSVWAEDFGAHAMVVDKIKDGRVYLRDPLPLYQGSSYSVTIQDFKRVFNKKFVTLKK